MKPQVKTAFKQTAKDIIEANVREKLSRKASKVTRVHEFLTNGKSHIKKSIEPGEWIALNASFNPGSSSFIAVKPYEVKPIKIGKKTGWYVVKPDLSDRIYFRDLSRSRFTSYDLTDNRAQDLEILVHQVQLDEDLVEGFNPDIFENFWDAKEYTFKGDSDLITLAPFMEEELLRKFKPNEYQDIMKVLQGKNLMQRQQEVNVIAEKIHSFLEEHGLKDFVVEARAKNALKISTKANNFNYHKVPDLRGIRIITGTILDMILAVGGSGTSMKEQGYGIVNGYHRNNQSAYRDHSACPKPNLFQSLIYNAAGLAPECQDKSVEIQTRTRFMDRMTTQTPGFTGSAVDYYIRDSMWYSQRLDVKPEEVLKFIQKEFPVFIQSDDHKD